MVLHVGHKMTSKHTHLQAETDGNWKRDGNKEDGKYQQEDSETALAAF